MDHPSNGLRPLRLAPPQPTKNVLGSTLFWRIIPDNMGIHSPAVLALSGRAMLDFAITEFSEVPSL
jgi:hypothetical protein